MFVDSLVNMMVRVPVNQIVDMIAVGHHFMAIVLGDYSCRIQLSLQIPPLVSLSFEIAQRGFDRCKGLRRAILPSLVLIELCRYHDRETESSYYGRSQQSVWCHRRSAEIRG